MADRLGGVALGVVLVALVAGAAVALGWVVVVAGSSFVFGVYVDPDALLVLGGRFMTLAACAGIAVFGLFGIESVRRG